MGETFLLLGISAAFVVVSAILLYRSRQTFRANGTQVKQRQGIDDFVHRLEEGRRIVTDALDRSRAIRDAQKSDLRDAAITAHALLRDAEKLNTLMDDLLETVRLEAAREGDVDLVELEEDESRRRAGPIAEIRLEERRAASAEVVED